MPSKASCRSLKRQQTDTTDQTWINTDNIQKHIEINKKKKWAFTAQLSHELLKMTPVTQRSPIFGTTPVFFNIFYKEWIFFNEKKQQLSKSPWPPHPVTAALVVCRCCIVVTLTRPTSEGWCHEWWHTKTLNHALICCRPASKCPRTTARQQFIFRLISFKTGKKTKQTNPEISHSAAAQN